LLERFMSWRGAIRAIGTERAGFLDIASQTSHVHVRFGSEPDIPDPTINVRFWG
jgi:hypothetical protein